MNEREGKFIFWTGGRKAGSGPAPPRKRRSPVRWVRHRTARSIVRALSNGAEDSAYLGVGGGWGRIRQGELIAAVRRNGEFGFFDHRTREIHWWAARRISAGQLFRLFFHELLHAIVRERKSAAHRLMRPYEDAAKVAWNKAGRCMARRRRIAARAEAG